MNNQSPQLQSNNTCPQSHNQPQSKLFDSNSSQLNNIPNPPKESSIPSKFAPATSQSTKLSVYPTCKSPMKKRPLEFENETTKSDRELSKKQKTKHEEYEKQIIEMERLRIDKEREEKKKLEQMERLKEIERVQRMFFKLVFIKPNHLSTTQPPTPKSIEAIKIFH
ncbi:hypothetical protein DICPUDRAFT_156153 [Dictyostelium purpureum]|uniref:Uncharacterized protein n=1 Tax=Dictyostelium purpureum TaxID=5786 RepID=F0ZVV1_DICPU|nr:uncharacterized protein DICPUDRAFT_156153 [Dictyostelium purpureum]EGC31938.1 hypothetical protein DICPUDRAFT_156153 [Dictyostelium purpureum]|eukprot:XP_003291540.1 hypothetical protein DICPUDRAFT_156153 [Dictyostelium purpureum]